MIPARETRIQPSMEKVGVAPRDLPRRNGPGQADARLEAELHRLRSAHDLPHNASHDRDVPLLEKWDIPLLASPTGADSNRLLGWLRAMGSLRQGVGAAS
jgi:hypothetical protein